MADVRRNRLNSWKPNPEDWGDTALESTVLGDSARANASKSATRPIGDLLSAVRGGVGSVTNAINNAPRDLANLLPGRPSTPAPAAKPAAPAAPKNPVQVAWEKASPEGKQKMLSLPFIGNAIRSEGGKAITQGLTDLSGYAGELGGSLGRAWDDLNRQVGEATGDEPEPAEAEQAQPATPVAPAQPAQARSTQLAQRTGSTPEAVRLAHLARTYQANGTPMPPALQARMNAPGMREAMQTYQAQATQAQQVAKGQPASPSQVQAYHNKANQRVYDQAIRQGLSPAAAQNRASAANAEARRASLIQASRAGTTTQVPSRQVQKFQPSAGVQASGTMMADRINQRRQRQAGRATHPTVRSQIQSATAPTFTPGNAVTPTAAAKPAVAAPKKPKTAMAKLGSLAYQQRRPFLVGGMGGTQVAKGLGRQYRPRTPKPRQPLMSRLGSLWRGRATSAPAAKAPATGRNPQAFFAGNEYRPRRGMPYGSSARSTLGSLWRR